MTKGNIENINEVQTAEIGVDQNQENLITLTEALAEYGELSSRFVSLSDEEKDRIAYLYNAILDSIDYVGEVHNEMLKVAESFSDFLNEKGLYEEFSEYAETKFQGI